MLIPYLTQLWNCNNHHHNNWGGGGWRPVVDELPATSNFSYNIPKGKFHISPLRQSGFKT